MLEYTSLLAAGIIVQIFISTYGLFSYAIVLRPLCAYRKTLFSSPFYTLCFALALLDILVLLDRMTIWISDPLLPYTSQFILQLRSFYERFLNYGIISVDLIIAMERAIVVFQPTGYNRIGNNKAVIIMMAIFSVCILASNVCIFTTVCPYVWYPNTTTVFIDRTVPSAILHNKVIDWVIQSLLKFVTLFICFITGFKVLKVRQKIQTHQKASKRKLKLEHALVLQTLIVTLPNSIAIIVYNIQIYVHDIPLSVNAVLTFTYQVMKVVGSSLNPSLHLLLNKDLRRTTVECWCNNVTVTDTSMTQSTSKITAINTSLNEERSVKTLVEIE